MTGDLSSRTHGMGNRVVSDSPLAARGLGVAQLGGSGLEVGISHLRFWGMSAT